jgi:hypothetical protein
VFLDIVKSDLIGSTFGKWNVVAFSHVVKRKRGYDYYYICQCRCGTQKPVCARLLRQGRSSACASCAHSKNAKWKTADGYVVVTAANHPNARKGGSILEHVLIMSQHLGRPLKPAERVHHIDGNRSNNAVENLELWDVGQPAGQRVADKIEHYRAFLELHGYTVTENDKPKV